MSGANNFEVFNEDYQNLTSDINYSANTARQGGLVDGIADTLLHNKLYRQTSVMTAALAAAMAAKEIDMLDSSLANLIISLGNLQIESEVDAKIEAASTSFVKTLLDDISASTFLTTLGVSTFVKTLLDDVDAAAARVTLGVDRTMSLASSGYYILPGGIILQWGVTGNVASDNSVAVTFPIAFPVACFNVTPTIKATAASNDNYPLLLSFNTAGCVLGRGWVTGMAGETLPLYWFAIGY